MSRITSCDGDLDDLGVLITRAFGVSRHWVAASICGTWRSDEMIPSPWQFDRDQRVTIQRDDGTTAVLQGTEMIKLALLECFRCPAQYDCARYALEAVCIAGTWSMKLVDLKWLQKQPEQVAADIIRTAERQGVPMQVHVRRARGMT